MHSTGTTIDSRQYNPAIPNCLPRSKAIISLIIVENVENPPRKPATNSVRVS